MDLNKHEIIKLAYNIMADVEKLGCSPELTAIVIALSALLDMADKLVDEKAEAQGDLQKALSNINASIVTLAEQMDQMNVTINSGEKV